MLEPGVCLQGGGLVSAGHAALGSRSASVHSSPAASPGSWVTVSLGRRLRSLSHGVQRLLLLACTVRRPLPVQPDPLSTVTQTPC